MRQQEEQGLLSRAFVDLDAVTRRDSNGHNGEYDVRQVHPQARPQYHDPETTE